MDHSLKWSFLIGWVQQNVLRESAWFAHLCFLNAFLKMQNCEWRPASWLALYFPWTALIWRALVTLLTSLLLSLPSSLLYSSLSSALFFFSRTATMSGERPGVGREDTAILEKKKKKKTANMMERAQKLNKLFSWYWFTKLWIKLYCHPYEREKSIGVSELILQFLLYLRMQ